MSRALTWLARILMLLVVGELAASVALRLLNPRLDERIRTVSDVLNEQTTLLRGLLDPNVKQLHELHPVLGWRYAPNYSEGQHRLNAAGLRSAREYAVTAPPHVVRIGVFGDSFTYGAEVSTEEAWPTLMEREDSGLEVLNYGVPGYGSDQAYLRYELEGADYAPDMVILGFPPTDLARAVGVYRRFFNNADIPLFKPRFVLDASDELSLIKAPVAGIKGYQSVMDRPESVIDLGANDQWFEPIIYRNPLYDHSAFVRLASATLFRVGRRLSRNKLMRDATFNTESTAFRIEVKIVQKFVDLARARRAIPMVVALPDRRVLQAIQSGGSPVYSPLITELKARHIDVVDASAAFAATDLSDGLDQWFAPFGHYSARANQQISTWLARALRDRFSREPGLGASAVIPRQDQQQQMRVTDGRIDSGR